MANATVRLVSKRNGVIVAKVYFNLAFVFSIVHSLLTFMELAELEMERIYMYRLII